MLICMRTGARARDRVVVCVFILRPAGKVESEDPRSRSGGRREQDWDSLGFCFSLKKRGGLFFFFLIGLDPPFLGGRGGRSGASEGLQGSGPFPALGGAGCGAGARCALLAALGGCPCFAPDAFGVPFPPRRAGSSLAQRLEHSRTRWKCARLRRPADLLERADALGQDSLVRSPGRAHGAWAGLVGCWRRPPAAWDPAGRSRGHGPWSEREGRPIPSRLSSHNSRLSSHNSRTGFCASPSLRGGSASSTLLSRRPARPYSRFSSGSLSLLLFLRPAPFPSAVWLPGKSCFLKFAKDVFKSPWGWLGTRGVLERDRFPELERASAGSPPRRLGAAASAGPIAGAKRQVPTSRGHG